MWKMLIRRFFMLLQIIVRIFKRAFCCFRRRRVSSDEFDSIPLSNIQVLDKNATDQQNWEEWNEQASRETKLSPTEQQILQYRQERVNPAKTSEEPSLDYFLDMTPTIVKQKKVLLPDGKTESTTSSFSLAPDPVFSSPELGTWEENQSWEADTELDVDVVGVVREQKRQERERRFLEQQRKKQERARHSGIVRTS